MIESNQLIVKKYINRKCLRSPPPLFIDNMKRSLMQIDIVFQLYPFCPPQLQPSSHQSIPTGPSNLTSTFTFLLLLLSNPSPSCLRIPHQLIRLKLTPHHTRDILDPMKRFAELFQFQQFGIIRIIKPRFDGNAIVDLVAKGMGGVIDEDDLG